MQLFQQHNHQEKVGMVTMVSGLVLIAVIFVVQYLSISSLSAGGSNNIILSRDETREFSDSALPTFAIIFVAIGMSIIGAGKILHSWKEMMSNYDVISQKKAPTLQRAKILIGVSLTREEKTFWLSIACYAIIFMFSSGMAIYSQENISNRYGVTVPSYYLIGCCGQPGSFPILTIYLSEHFGLLLVPMNLILLSFLPLLVAINVTAFVHNTKFSSRDNARHKTRMGRNISVCGISAGMLAGCPTCTGSVLFSLVGTGSLSSLGAASATIVSYQPLLVITSISMLLVAPIVSVIFRKS